MNTLIEQLIESGIKTGTEKPADVTAFPHYRGNSGFYHIIGNDWEIFLIKGVYKDSHRDIKGKSPFDKKTINNMAQILADTERNLRKPLVLKMYEDDGKFYVTKAEEYKGEFDLKRDPHITAPLTTVERSLGKGDIISDKHLFIRTPFAEITPEVLSPVAMSLLSGIPDVLNPLFISCSIKTQSPSIKLLFGRLYMNMINIETIMPAFKATPDLFMMNFAPTLFRSVKKPLFGTPDDSDLKISDVEIEEALQDVTKAIEDLKPEDMFGDDFLEIPALLTMTWEMVYIRLWKAFTAFHKLLGKDIDNTLVHIYKTRKDTLLNLDIADVSENIDPASDSGDFKGLGLEHLSIEEMYKSLGSAKRLTTNKGKYINRLKECHQYLKLRDDVYLSLMKLTGKLRSYLDEYSRKMLEDSMITEVDSIFNFELKEISNIINDNFYGNIPFTVNFRKWQVARFNAMCMPYNIYERDVEEAGSIANQQIENSQEAGNIRCLSYFYNSKTETDTVVKKCWNLLTIHEASDKQTVISEAGSMFSFIAEYCAVTDKQFYSGARFADILLKDKKISLSKDLIAFK